MIRGQIFIYVQVPLMDRKHLLDMLKFNNTPKLISDTIMLQLTPLDTIFAIRQKGVHVAMTQMELDQYPKYSQVYFGNSAVTLNYQINATCLDTISSQDYQNIRNVCPTKFSITNKVFIHLAPNEIICYTKTP